MRLLVKEYMRDIFRSGNTLLFGLLFVGFFLIFPQRGNFGDDGNIYIINNDGEIEKYNQGKKEKFVYHKLRPLINNNSIIKTFKNSNYLYIIDPNNNRVIILNKDGNIKDQFTSDKFDNLIDLAIDSEEKSIYLLNSNHLYLLAINN